MSKKTKPAKVKTAEDKEASVQIIKSVAAVICAAAVCVGVSSSAKKISEAKIQIAEKAPVGYALSNLGGSAAPSGDSSPVADSGVSTDTAILDSNPADSTDTPIDNGGTPATPDAPSADSSASKDNTNGVPQSKAEIIAYCNNALNNAKASKVGYTKTFVRKGGDNLPSVLTKVIARDKKTTMEKGSDDITDDFPAAGYSWSSKLRESDVTTATLKQNGQYYEITLKLGKEVNPSKGEASSYGRVMSVIDANDAKNLVPGIKSVNMTYHDGYVYAKIDAKTGKLVKAEFSAAADIQASIAVLGDISASNLISTETFTDIKY